MSMQVRRSAAWSARQGEASRQAETGSPLVPQGPAPFFRTDDDVSIVSPVPLLSIPTPLISSLQDNFGGGAASPVFHRNTFGHSPNNSSHAHQLVSPSTIPQQSPTAAGMATASPPSVMTAVAAAPPTWKKGLYERQPFDDNYVDPVQFLQELKKNSNIRNYEYTEIAKDTLVVVQQISLVVVFVFMFASIIAEQVSLTYVVAVDIGLLFVGALCYTTLWFLQQAEAQHHQQNVKGSLSTAPDSKTKVHKNQGSSGGGNGMPRENSSASTGSAGSGPKEERREADESHRVSFGEGFDRVVTFTMKAILFGCALLLLSPVFQTLTASYTDDTIWALAIMAFSLHLLLTDYGYLNSVEKHYTNGIGVNAATFASILMASRIESPLFGAALIGFGILLFNLSPLLRHRLRSYSVTAHVGLTFLFIGVTMGCLAQVPLLAGMFLICVVLICGVVPYFFVWLQASYKNQISGPWDEAKPINSVAAAEWANAGLLS